MQKVYFVEWDNRYSKGFFDYECACKYLEFLKKKCRVDKVKICETYL